MNSSDSPREERASTATHAVGALLSVAGLVALVVAARATGDLWQVASTAVYGLTLVILYVTSTVYHATHRRPSLRKYDHAAIFLLIAGSYTPFVLVTLRGPWGWSLFGVVWSLAIAGIFLKFRYAGRFKVASTLIYLGMGWLIMVAIKPLMAALPMPGLVWLVAGGICYSVGSLFYLWKKLPYQHAVWHLWVMAGSACQWVAVYGYVIDRS